MISGVKENRMDGVYVDVVDWENACTGEGKGREKRRKSQRIRNSLPDSGYPGLLQAKGRQPNPNTHGARISEWCFRLRIREWE